MEINKNIMWVVGAAGTGKTTMYEFLRKNIVACEIYDEDRTPAMWAINDRLFSDEYEGVPLIVFSQEAPPELVNGKPFNPILIKLSNENNTNNLKNWFIQYFEESEDKSDFFTLEEIQETIFSITEIGFLTFSFKELNNVLLSLYKPTRYRKPYDTKFQNGFCLKLKKQ